MAALNVDYIVWIITVLGAINSNLTFIFDLNYFLWKLKASKRQGVSSLLETKQSFSLKWNQFLECQSEMLKFLSPMLNLQSYRRPTGRNFGAPKNMEGLCFQVLGSLGVLGVLGVFVFKTPASQLKKQSLRSCCCSFAHLLPSCCINYTNLFNSLKIDIVFGSLNVHLHLV